MKILSMIENLNKEMMKAKAIVQSFDKNTTSKQVYNSLKDLNFGESTPTICYNFGTECWEINFYKLVDYLPIDKVYTQKENIISANIRVGSEVVVVDGSYILDENLKHIFGIEFTKNGLFEVLTVTKINEPMATEKSDENILIPQNNCEIMGRDGRRYYCSHINIRPCTIK